MNHKQEHILLYLEAAESSERDEWNRQDYRVAWLVVVFADKGKAKAYELSFLELFGRKPEQVVSWWRDRSALRQLAEQCGSNTPLLHANQAEQILKVVPDYDPSADSRRALPPKKSALSATTDTGSAGRKKAAL